MKHKKTSYFLVTLVVILSLYIVYLYNDPYKVNIRDATEKTTISAEEITASFIKNEKKATAIYKGKVVKVYGIIKEITFINNTNTIILQSNYTNFNVLCNLQLPTSKQPMSLKVGQKVTIKGVCKGFLHDVIFLNCMLVNTPNNE